MKHLFPYLVCNILLFTNANLLATKTAVKKTVPKEAFSKKASKAETAKDSKKEEFSKKDVQLLSQAYGHMIGQNLNAIGLDLDSNEIIHGIQDAFNGAESPMEDTKTIEMITALQEKKFKDECSTNLKAAEAFLASNQSNKQIIELEKGKLQYKRLETGTGKVCTEEDTPVITYVGKYLNGEVFGKSEREEPISLKETIEGFRKAIVGMKVGEKREVYIHPDFGYGASSCLSPNSLLTFEISLKGVAENIISAEDTIKATGDFPIDNSFADTTLQYENVK